MTNISREAVEKSCAQADFGLLPDQPMSDLCRALLARVEELQDDRDTLSEYAFEATKAIVGLTASGSEFFAGKLPDGRYKADLPRCVKYVRDTKETLHAQVKKQHERGRLQGLGEARQQAAIVERDGSYFGDMSVDTTDSIYQQGACEVREAIEALKGPTS